MKFVSTRRHDGSGEREVYTFEEALLSGYAPDGGLFVPSNIPRIANERLHVLSEMSYPRLAYEILRIFISADEVGDDDLRDIVANSYPVEEFDDNSFVPVKRLGSSGAGGAYIAELFHGPTYCFKDLGMMPVINFLSFFASRANRPTTLLVSTTGDTGPAAVHAVNRASNPLLTILVHYPDGQISDFQRRQLTTIESRFVKVASFEGGGDDMDLPIKETLLENDEAKSGRKFTGINSYNIGRPLAQMVHFVWIYFRVAEQLGIRPGDASRPIDMVIPTGAMGNITALYLTKRLGLPVGFMCAGTNINDITHRVIERGEFHKKSIKRTLSEAINIEVPYNFERVAYYLTNENPHIVRRWMQSMELTQELTLDANWLERLQAEFKSARVDDNEMMQAMRDVISAHGYLLDPHTAVAVSAAEKLGYSIIDGSNADDTKNPIVIIATASPCKFEGAVTATIGIDGWDKWATESFPPRARATINAPESQPLHYPRSAGLSTSERNSKWREKMLNIIEQNF